MNVYDAIMRAADQIDRDPKSFAYHRGMQNGDDSCGCAVLWTARFLGVAEMGFSSLHDAARVFGVQHGSLFDDTEETFTGRMTRLDHNWSRGAAQCACTLRLYAAKYHDHAKPDTGFRDFMQKALPQYREKAHAVT